MERFESNELRVRFRRRLFDQLVEGKTGPWHDHGPRFNAAQPIDTFLKPEHFHQFQSVDGHRPFHQAADLNWPRRSHELVHVAVNVFAQGKFVEIVVLPRRPFIGQRPGRIELRIARRGKGLGRLERSGAVGRAGRVGGRRVVFRAAGQRCRQQTQTGATQLP